MTIYIVIESNLPIYTDSNRTNMVARPNTVAKICRLALQSRLLTAQCPKQQNNRILPLTTHKHHTECGSLSSRSQPVVIQENGETIIRSPYKDLELPVKSFAEFMFSELDSHKKELLMVSACLFYY